MRLKIVFVLWALAVVAQGEVIYRNDFSTRVSTGSVPTGEWESFSYVRNQQVYSQYNVGADGFNRRLPWGGGQDGWAKANISSSYVNNSPGFYIDADPGSDNSFVYFRASNEKVGVAVHSIGQEFTNGVLRFDFDFRRPATWGGDGPTYALRLVPLFRKYVDPDWEGRNLNAIQYPVYVGALWDKNSGKTYDRIGYGNPLGSLYEVNGKDFSCEANNWYHWRVYLDLEQKTVKAYFWDRGAQQPDGAADEQGEANPIWANSATRYFVYDMTSETGGIAGYALASYRAVSGSGDNLNLANAPCFDNVFVAWKAPGGSEFTSFYENTFDKRRRRALTAGATSYVYPAATPHVVEDVFAAYVANSPRDTLGNPSPTMVCNSNQNLDEEPVGMDNWRRTYGGGLAAVVASETAGGNVLRLAQGDHKAVLAQTLGRQYRSGKVRVSADVRLPAAWRTPFSERPRVNLSLGNDDHWTKRNQITSTTIGYGSIATFKKEGDNFLVDDFHPSLIPPNGGSLDSMADMSFDCTPTNWYRMVVTADLDARTYGFDLYELGPEAGNFDRTVGDKVYSRSGISFRNKLSSVSSFAFWNYGFSDTWETFILWDNIRAWAFSGDEPADADLIYSNDFNVRTRRVERDSVRAYGRIYQDDGLDHWKRIVEEVDDTAEDIVAGTDNRFLSLRADGQGTVTRTISHLGRNIHSGIVRMRCDMRPPSYWLNNSSSRRFVFYAGGETFAQGSASPAYYEESQLAFGFMSQSGTSLGRKVGAVLRAQDGTSFVQRNTAIDTTHWFRFVVDCDLNAGRYTCKVYDQGTAHPQMDAPVGTLVETFTDFKCRSDSFEGLSAFGIAFDSAIAVTPWDPYDTGRALLDNIEVKKVDGTLILFR